MKNETKWYINNLFCVFINCSFRTHSYSVFASNQMRYCVHIGLSIIVYNVSFVNIATKSMQVLFTQKVAIIEGRNIKIISWHSLSHNLNVNVNSLQYKSPIEYLLLYIFYMIIHALYDKHHKFSTKHTTCCKQSFTHYIIILHIIHKIIIILVKFSILISCFFFTI